MNLLLRKNGQNNLRNVCRLLFCVLAAVATYVPLYAAARPNIIIILADDLGYADIGVYGCKDVPTPHIDQIAKSGVRFTQGYASHPVCAPSRAGLLSGMYSQRFGFENNSGPEEVAADNFGYALEIPTLAEKLNKAGYTTGLIGKWHLGFKEGMRPNERGFDYFYGFLGGSRSYNPTEMQDSVPLVRNDEIVTNEKEYLTDAFAREAASFIQRSVKGTSTTTTNSSAQSNSLPPFFLYLSFNAVHLPMEAPSRYQDSFQHIEDPKRRKYAGMLAAMDDAVGRVMKTVRDLGQEEDTLVFFYSDNGGPPQTKSNNGPLRGYKGEVYEGGIRVPFLAQWPGTIAGNLTYENPVIAFDCHATALAVAAVTDKSGDGVNLLPYISGDNKHAPHPMLCWRFNSSKAIRMGDWKLVRTAQASEGQLFNLKDDIGEQTDLTDKHPEKVNELSAKLTDWEKQMKPPAWQSSEGKQKPRSKSTAPKRKKR